MQITTQSRNTQIRGTVLETQAATIELNAVIFGILSGRIYSNKIAAVVRELSCNAADSHRQAGHTKPFDVQLPTDIESVFRIRDYGVGLSHENIFNLYMNFGASTKRESSNLIGGFGIGSKAPLAYTSGFTVNSFFNGEQRSYRIFIGEDGKPATMHLHTQPTKETNGLEVAVPVNKGDVHNFNFECEKLYKWFSIQPNFVGRQLAIEQPVFSYKDENIGLGWEGAGENIIIVGDVAYKLSLKDAIQTSNCKTLECFYSTPFVMFANIDEVDVAASRETLEYTPKTIRSLNDKLMASLHNCREAFQKEINSSKTMWEASCKYAILPKTFWFLSKLSFCWKGLEIERRLDILDKNNVGLVPSAFLYQTDTHKKALKLKFYPLRDVYPWRTKVVVLDCTDKITARLKTLASTLKVKTEDLLILEGRLQNKASLDNALKQMDGADVVYLSTVTPKEEFLPVKSSKTSPQYKIKEYNFTTGKLSLDMLVSTPNYTKETIVILTGKNLSTPFALSLLSCMAVVKALGYTEDKFAVIRQSKFTKKLKENKNLVLIEDWLARDDKQAVLKNLVSEAIYKKNLIEKLHPFQWGFKEEKLVKHLFSITNSSLLKETVEAQEALRQLIIDKGVSFWTSCKLLIKGEPPVFQGNLSFNFKCLETFYKKYPLLRYLSETTPVSEIQNYISLVDKNEKLV